MGPLGDRVLAEGDDSEQARTMKADARAISVIVSLPVLLQNIDLTGMAIALPDMARSLHAPALHLNIVIAAYAISLAAFLPLSAWLADRFSASRVFCVAIGIFALASAM